MSRIRKFYDRYILPLHISTDNAMHLSTDMDPEAESYFTPPIHPEYLYLNHISFEQGKLENHLSNLWRDQPELLKSIPDLVKLAFELKEENKEQSAELSPFVYVMF